MKRILVANRGEIARRVFRTAHALGITCVAVYSDPDADAPHVRDADLAVHLPGTSSTDTYLNVAAILDAAKRTGADAIHPGYGFLSENPGFAEAVGAAGLTWIGPTPASIRSMALKIEAKELAARAGVPLAAGAALPESASDGELQTICDGIGYPLLIKASAGGGGKGMRLVTQSGEVLDAVGAARREAMSAFADGTVFAERYLTDARHVEVQIFGDTHGNVVHLFERECSIQRRHQKIVEEAPSPGIDEATRTRLCDAAVALASHIGYVGAGTVEFMVSGTDIAFLEMNTRLQVEHPVTEMTTGIDLVAWQIAVADGKPLPLRQEEISRSGHAIEVRLYAEDPARGDLPATGSIALIDTAGPRVAGLRIDSGVESGSVISPYYDPMLAKIIAAGSSRDEAAARLALGLRRMRIHGPVTNRDMLVAILESEPFLAGTTTTAFLEQHPQVRNVSIDQATADLHAIGAALFAVDIAVPGVPRAWRNVPAVPELQVFTLRGADTVTAVRYAPHGEGFTVAIARSSGLVAETERARDVTITRIDDEHIDLVCDGIRRHIGVYRDGDQVFVDDGLDASAWRIEPRFVDHTAQQIGSNPQAPVPGTVTGVHVAAGDRVEAGQLLVTLEAMKMEHRLVAAHGGLVEQVLVRVGDSVDAHQTLVQVQEEE